MIKKTPLHNTITVSVVVNCTGFFLLVGWCVAPPSVWEVKSAKIRGCDVEGYIWQIGCVVSIGAYVNWGGGGVYLVNWRLKCPNPQS